METIVRVQDIPIDYSSLTSKANTIFTNVGGDAYNTAQALKWLGNDTDLLAMIDKKTSPDIINETNNPIKLPTEYILPKLNAMPSAVTFYADNKKQQVFEDTKDLADNEYNMDVYKSRLNSADMVVLSNVCFCKPMLENALEKQVPIAVNIRDFGKEDLKFNDAFLSAADIIYISDDDLTKNHYEFVKEIAEIYSPKIIILGRGSNGVLFYSSDDKIFAEYKSVKTLEIVNTVGAGNALLSCFLHYYKKTGDAVLSIKNALLFASYKIGFVGTSNGFMTEEQIEQWHNIIWNR